VTITIKHTHTNTHTLSLEHARARTHTHTHTHTTHTHTHIHTHTNTHMSHYAALRTTSRRNTVLLQGRITLALSTWPYRLVGILTCVPAATPLVEDNVCEAPEEPTFKVALVFISSVRHRCRAHRRDSRRRSIMILLPVFTLCAWRLLCCRQLWRLQRFSFILVGGLCGCYCWYIALPAPAHSLERSAFGETASLFPAHTLVDGFGPPPSRVQPLSRNRCNLQRLTFNKQNPLS